MIVFDLSCEHGHGFEGWFGSSTDFAVQREQGLVACPQCGSLDVSKAPMAPAVGRKGNQQIDRRAPDPSSPEVGVAPEQGLATGPMPPEVQKALNALAEAQAKALEKSKWVGKDFAERSRAMHYGERDAEAIHGEASLEEAQKLVEEGIEIAPLPFPVTPPEDLN